MLHMMPPDCTRPSVNICTWSYEHRTELSTCRHIWALGCCLCRLLLLLRLWQALGHSICSCLPALPLEALHLGQRHGVHLLLGHVDAAHLAIQNIRADVLLLLLAQLWLLACLSLQVNRCCPAAPHTQVQPGPHLGQGQARHLGARLLELDGVLAQQQLVVLWGYRHDDAVKASKVDLIDLQPPEEVQQQGSQLLQVRYALKFLPDKDDAGLVANLCTGGCLCKLLDAMVLLNAQLNAVVEVEIEHAPKHQVVWPLL
mmetsp:Transcript_40412/g.89774  ORF Transcript_40412/g.89774 Transcript_40412/m.89774 type:complete len:257 (+) Transcript_40412:2385-3155(+)